MIQMLRNIYRNPDKIVGFISELKSIQSLVEERFYVSVLENLLIVSPDLARFVASELSLQSLSKKDLVKCLKALGVKHSEILSLQ
jgi:hypothetical protein